MGNIFSSEEKLLRHQRNEIITGRNPRQIFEIYEHYGCPPADISFGRQSEHRYKKKRNVSFHGRYGKNYHIKTKSQSLNAILEELYSLAPEDDSEEGKSKINFENGRSLIPRIKLKRSTSSLKEEKSYKALCKMSSQSGIFIERDLTNSSPDVTFKNENNEFNAPENNIMTLLNDQSYDKMSKKSDENYFTKNFDDCMKRLELIEKEHELMEKEDTEVQFRILQKENENAQMDFPEINKISPNEDIRDFKSEYEVKNFENWSVEEKSCENEIKSENQQISLGKTESVESCLKETESVKSTEEEAFTKENKEPAPITWYSNLKQQFEKRELENHEPKTKEMSCRITGATLKSQNEKAKSEDTKKDTKHYFHRLVKTNKSLIDEELPDPDKVKHIRAMFQETLNSTLKRQLNKKLGGSLQNISFRTTEQQMNRPLSAQCYRNDLFCDQKPNEEKNKKTSFQESSKLLRDGNKEFQIENTKRKLLEKYEKDLKPGKEYRSRRVLPSKWTDTGSVSSGISSDLSSYDTDLESISREGTEHDEVTISDDDLLEEMKEKHYVQNEVLEKIRSFGTSVTYYGGEMITCSIGPLLSPTTQAIMEEISEKYGHETNPARSFDEFYRKYVETNESNRKKKLGRTRSFGQNDVFQKPNVLSNAEIEMYKNDLEIEIGIKKPAGIPQNSLKKKIVKSASLDSKMEIKVEKTDSETPILTSESDNRNDSNTRKQISEEAFNSTDFETINKNVTKKITTVNTPNSETKFRKDGAETHTDLLENKETENKTEKEEEPQKPFETESVQLRSKSVIEGFSVGKNILNNKYEIISNDTEHPAKEIFFSYEKSLFNGKRNSDMEFEEFEVCESLSEKLEKLEKKNIVEKTMDNLESLSQAEMSKTFENKAEEKPGNVLAKPASENSDAKNEENDFQDLHINDRENSTMGKIENNQNEKKDLKYNYPRWPIETSVMVDIQKNNEQTPKIITCGKTVAKTKIRLF